MKRLVLTMALITQSLTSLAQIDKSLPTNYQSLSACAKQELLWDKVQNTTHQELPKLSRFGLFQLVGMWTQPLSKKIEYQADVSPKGWKKYLHRRGSVAKVRFVPTENHPYTGILRGAECALLRLSITYRPTKKRNFAPGLALKVLRDGIPSANVSALYRLEGQEKNYNILENPLSNIVPIGQEFGLKLVHKIFKRVTAYPEELLLSHLAERTESGEREIKIVTPRQIFFVPTNKFQFSQKPHDFRHDLKKIPRGSKLYQVFVLPSEPKSTSYSQYKNSNIENFLKDSQYIGDLVTTSEFVASEFGDEGLFFRHEVRPK